MYSVLLPSPHLVVVVEYANLLSWIWWAPVWTLLLNSDSMNIEFMVITPLFMDIYFLACWIPAFVPRLTLVILALYCIF